MGRASCFVRRLNPLRKISEVIRLAKDVNIVSTIYWNFKFFPFKIAKRLPVFIGYDVDIQSFKLGGVNIESDVIQRGMIKIGITPLPTFPSKGLHTLIRFHGNSSITFGKDVSIMKGCSIIATYGGRISIGSDVLINQHTLIFCNSSIKICNHISIGWQVQIYDSPLHCVIDINTGEIKNPVKHILISDNVWIGNHATISAGAKIPPFTIVASHSLVNKDYMEDACIGGLLVGVPAQYRETGKVRLLNDCIEYQIKTTAFSDINCRNVNISEVGYNVSPIIPQKNILYRSK